MTYSNVIIISLCLLLTQNVFLANFITKCDFFKYNNRRYGIIRFSVISFVIVILYIIGADLIYNKYLVPNNLEYLSIIIFVFYVIDLLQIAEICFKKFSKKLKVNSKTYLTLAINVLMQVSFCTLFILNNISIYKTIEYCIIITVSYTIFSYVFTFIALKFDEFDLPEAVKGIPIGLLTISMIAFSLFGLF